MIRTGFKTIIKRSKTNIGNFRRFKEDAWQFLAPSPAEYTERLNKNESELVYLSSVNVRIYYFTQRIYIRRCVAI